MDVIYGDSASVYYPTGFPRGVLRNSRTIGLFGQKRKGRQSWGRANVQVRRFQRQGTDAPVDIYVSDCHSIMAISQLFPRLSLVSFDSPWIG